MIKRSLVIKYDTIQHLKGEVHSKESLPLISLSLSHQSLSLSFSHCFSLSVSLSLSLSPPIYFNNAYLVSYESLENFNRHIKYQECWCRLCIFWWKFRFNTTFQNETFWTHIHQIYQYMYWYMFTLVKVKAMSEQV